MKKHISIMCLIAVFNLQSCERTDSILSSENEIVKENKLSAKDIFSSQESTNKSGDSSLEDYDTGDDDDDEPRKDKSHWRTKNDSVR